MRRGCDGPGLLAALRAGVANLEAHVDEINGLNVYPVPDGDTGSNMLATVRAALEAAERVHEPTLTAISAAISSGALMGARGNSGVIMSQIFRGMAEAVAGRQQCTGSDLAAALSLGSQTAYRAVVRPVEGTILTVIREASVAAAAAAQRFDDMASVLTATVDEIEASLARTPLLLPILREAGVVDAGAAGLARVFEGALAHLTGAVAGPAEPLEGARAAALVAHAEEEFGYETMFLIQPRPHDSLDPDAIRGALETIGDSVVVAGDGQGVTVHVHSDRPDQVLAFGVEHGILSRVSVENLDAQTREVRDHRVVLVVPAGRDGQGVSAEDATPPGSAGSGAQPAPRSVEIPLAVVAVTAGEGLVAVFRSLGAARIVSGGQGANPSVGELLAAVEATDAAHVILLPNNPNVLLASTHAASRSDRSVSVVPTRNAPEGLAALLALDPAASPDQTVAAMTRAARSIQTLQVTRAVRDTRIGERAIGKGDVIVLDPDDGIVAADPNEARAVLTALDSLTAGFELLTLYYGDGVDLAAAESLGRRIAGHCPGVEIEIVHGGQPHYRYLIAAE